jgi:histidine ammonia-lyase
VLAIELLTAVRALDCLLPLRSSQPIERVREEFRKVSAAWTGDRPLAADIEKAAEWIASGALNGG